MRNPRRANSASAVDVPVPDMPVTRMATTAAPYPRLRPGPSAAHPWLPASRSRRAPGPHRVRDCPRLAERGGEGSVARELNEVGVVGLGTMGAGIVEVLSRAGL